MLSTGVTTFSKGVQKKVSTGDALKRDNHNEDNHKSDTPKMDVLKKQSDEPTIAKMRHTIDSIRADNTRLRQALDSERSAVRALKAQHDSAMRKERADARRREELLDKQIRIESRSSNKSLPLKANDAFELTKLTNQLQASRESNKKLQDKLKEFRELERTRTTEMRAQHDSQRRLLLEELKTKDRLLMQLKKHKQYGDGRRRASTLGPGPISAQEKGPPDDNDAATDQMTERLAAEVARLEEELRGRDDLIRTLRERKMIEKNNTEESPRAEIRHRKETSYRENFASDADSAISSAPSSLSPQPSNEVWSTNGGGGCGACRAASSRAAAAAREAARLTHQLRDARDQLELLEFRLLELEDCSAEKCLQENLTDSDSGCVSPGSRLKDSASPIFRRTDSGYKSPTTLSPTSPCSDRRLLETPTHKTFSDFDNLTDSALSDSVLSDRNLSDSVSSDKNLSDSISLERNLSDSRSCVRSRANPTKEHLETMIVNAVSMEDRNCLEQVMLLLCNLQALNNSMSEEDFLPVKPKPICDLRPSKNDVELQTIKTQKIIATVSPYSQNSFTRCEAKSIDNDQIGSLQKYFDGDGKKIVNVLQESGIFEDVETDEKETQTELSSGEGNSLIDASGDLNTEIQRLNSIREQLERKSVTRNRSINSQSRASPQFDDSESLECRCVKLGKKHRQYYERRLKFLEGKISIYESAQDVKEAKLAQRLQNEFILESNIEELESHIDKLQARCSQLEEDCCELEESENDTRLHCQQLEIEYELVSAQLRDMAENRESLQSKEESLRRTLRELERHNDSLEQRECLLRERLYALEQATPISVFWNVYNILKDLPTPINTEPSPESKSKYSNQLEQNLCDRETQCQALVKWKETTDLSSKLRDSVEQSVKDKTTNVAELNKRLSDLELKIAQSDLEKRDREQHVQALEVQLETSRNMLQCYQSSTPETVGLESSAGHELQRRVVELEKRELAYLEMLTQADEMWAEMEAGYKERIREVERQEHMLREQLCESEAERNRWKSSLRPLRSQLRELEEAEGAWRAGGERAAREARELRERNERLAARAHGAEAQLAHSQQDLRDLQDKYKTETEANRQKACRICDEVTMQKMIYLENEETYRREMDRLKKELANSCKTILDIEVTNGELKEEVESLESQLILVQEQMSQCKLQYEEHIKSLSGELADTNKEMEFLRCEAMNFKNMPSALDELQQVRNSYEDEYMLTTAVPKFFDTRDTDCNDNVCEEIETYETKLCPCNRMRKQMIGILIEDLFSRVHNGVDESARILSNRILQSGGDEEMDESIERDIEAYLLDSIVRDLKRSVGDAEEKILSDAWSEMVHNVSQWGQAGDAATLAVPVPVCAAARLSSVSCACAAATVCAAVQARLPPAQEHQRQADRLRRQIKRYQEVVLTNEKVRETQDEVSAALRNLVNCSMCSGSSPANTAPSALWSTDV